jgi:BirA family biotin operon repressor/biotin-[acetyl-CoA-carboxylase] ligase
LRSTSGSLSGVILDERTAARLAATTRFGVIRQFERLDSTNRYLLDEARSGAADGTVAVAGYQTAGRGRQGRVWEAPPHSSLLVSVLLRPRHLPADRRYLATAAVALAAASACEEAAGFLPRLKWPNDLVVDDGKLAGVLAEVDGSAIVVGLGLNLDWPSDRLPEGATAVNRVSGRPADAGRVLVAFLTQLDRRCRQLEEAAGREALSAAAREASATIGREVRVELAGGTVAGRAEDVDELGHLRVRTADGGLVEVTAGDVVHLRPA